MKRKEYIILVVLCILVIIAGLHERYIGSGIRFDIYPFYDYLKGRYLSNIIMDFSRLITTSTLLFILYLQSITKNLKRIFFPFLLISIADIVDYILFFQKQSHIKLFVLAILLVVFIYYKKQSKSFKQ